MKTDDSPDRWARVSASKLSAKLRANSCNSDKLHSFARRPHDLVTWDEVDRRYGRALSSIFASEAGGMMFAMLKDYGGLRNKMKKSVNRVGSAFMSLLMLAAVCVAAGSTAQAQYRQYPDGRVRQERRERDDHYRRERRDRDGDGDYDRRDEYIRRRQQQQRNNGYGTYGNNGRYGTYGNNGRYGTYGNNGGYNQAAMNQGYQNGLNTGASDAQRGQSYNPQRSHYYKDASSQAFREGFLQGYDQGYRQYAGYGSNGGYRRNTGIGNILGGIFGRP